MMCLERGIPMIPVKGNATYLSDFLFPEKGKETIRMSCFGISNVIIPFVYCY